MIETTKDTKQNTHHQSAEIQFLSENENAI